MLPGECLDPVSAAAIAPLPGKRLNPVSATAIVPLPGERLDPVSATAIVPLPGERLDPVSAAAIALLLGKCLDPVSVSSSSSPELRSAVRYKKMLRTMTCNIVKFWWNKICFFFCTFFRWCLVSFAGGAPRPCLCWCHYTFAGGAPRPRLCVIVIARSPFSCEIEKKC